MVVMAASGPIDARTSTTAAIRAMSGRESVGHRGDAEGDGQPMRNRARLRLLGRRREPLFPAALIELKGIAPSTSLHFSRGSAFFTYRSNQRSSSYASCSFDSIDEYQCGS